MEETNVDYQTYSKMQNQEPFKTYRKAIVANVLITVLSPFSDKPEVIILHGANDTPSAMIDLWNEKQNEFFKRANRLALETGKIIPFAKPKDFQELRVEPYADASDETLSDLLDSKKTKFFSFTQALASIKSETVLFRLLNLAREQEKSSTLIEKIEKRLSEVQNVEQES